jgi:hypothetical protein
LKKTRIIWPIAILAMFVLTMPYMVKRCNGGRRLSELDVEQQYSRNIPVQVTGAPVLPLKEDEIDLTNTTSRQDRLQMDNQQGGAIDSVNIDHVQVCASEWLDGGLSVQETLRCVEGNTSRMNNKQYG